MGQLVERRELSPQKKGGGESKLFLVPTHILGEGSRIYTGAVKGGLIWTLESNDRRYSNLACYLIRACKQVVASDKANIGHDRGSTSTLSNSMFASRSPPLPLIPSSVPWGSLPAATEKEYLSFRTAGEDRKSGREE